ncbi:hypothetical protein K435DRAFT_368781 [Dendrothele bispora CBS 962.96]|uniref:Uncharacterized protein n=1 Tax=Dendrothele bispora (strain CBS 962.96) TaxID=1314807 RepID=A0A4S8MHC6_DENBC|nr:hypothetical protein K435DRAFT_368781 [Dendrothele bispora CBS 962.96]
MEQWPDSLTIVLDDWDFPENEAWQHLEGLNPNYTQSAFYKRSVMRFNQTLNKAESTAWIVNASEGADLAFYGWAPASSSQGPSTFQVVDSSGRTQMMQYSSANTLGEIFVSNASMDGFALEFLQETRIDYVLKKVSENETDLRNSTIVLVDDFNSEIKWEGLWDRKPHYSLNPPYENPDDGDLEQGSPLPVMQPHGGGTHTSTTEGDFFSFQFAGECLSFV